MKFNIFNFALSTAITVSTTCFIGYIFFWLNPFSFKIPLPTKGLAKLPILPIGKVVPQSLKPELNIANLIPLNKLLVFEITIFIAAFIAGGIFAICYNALDKKTN